MLFSFVLVSTLAACGGEEESGGDGELQDTYTVASDTSFVPFEFKEDGEYVGFDIDLIHAVADEAGFNIELETTNFDGIIPGLQTGSFDMAVAGIGITEKRKKKIDYSDPYFESGLAIGVQKDNDSIKDIDDLEGKTIATRLGSTSSKYIKENIDNADTNQYEQLDQAYLAVENGSADAILYDAPNVKYYINTTGDKLKVVGDLYKAEDYAIAISKGQEELVKSVDEALQTIKDNGTYDEIYEKWFGEKSE
ncbi:transporter substrate-binding domain-containing protein [Lentibacillus cibarius]|uniref:Transporter substrate-binding domain-containing protein n=1 Tax=Lentibacillus cibarius TaxID=2583219 RepID=A0A549YN12_9BACI|nr:transporter substrate-binding domain-containing protein [Lentibacillus cibarius]TMN23903.1 transporter substrate-binding domain-containing protein [Lentibacillus cibarius]TRM13247.1 transporter substrate-binding domain-containing protein [Lentibacillus cibarius]